MSETHIKDASFEKENNYFMGIAFLTAKRSKGSRRKVGACLINEDKIIIGVGYNDILIELSDGILHCNTNNNKRIKLTDSSEYVCHAATNVILHKSLDDLKNSKLYITMFPCFECTKCIVKSGIKEVVYLSENVYEQDMIPESMLMLDKADIKYRQWFPKEIQIYFK